MSDARFKKIVWEYYRLHRRFFLWRPRRGTRRHLNPYLVFVSEVMLQQTQANRVQAKLPEFLKRFPTFRALARAPKGEVLSAWQGLGYNRRALSLHRSAKLIARKFNGKLPEGVGELDVLPGIGPNTAGSITAFAFNAPSAFIETNVRRVYIHHYFPKKRIVHDRDLMPIIARTVDARNPREWYYALMDYGSTLPRTLSRNPNTQSRHYAKQTPFIGSRRELRGRVLATVLREGRISTVRLAKVLGAPHPAVQAVSGALAREGFFRYSGAFISTTKP